MSSFTWTLVFIMFCSCVQLMIGQHTHAFFVLAIIIIVVLMAILQHLEQMNFGEWK